jgi:MFS family permease
VPRACLLGYPCWMCAAAASRTEAAAPATLPRQRPRPSSHAHGATTPTLPGILEAPMSLQQAGSTELGARGWARKRRSAGFAMVGIFAFKVSLQGFGPIFSELLQARACDQLQLPPYPDEQCKCNPEASAHAAQRSAEYNLMVSVPALVTVSLYAMLADSHGRKATLLLCYTGLLCQMLVVWLLPAGRVCVGPVCVADSFDLLLAGTCVASFMGGWAVALSTSFAVMADVTEGESLSTRATVFGLMEACNIGGGVVGPIVTGLLAQEVGLQTSLLFSVCGACVAVGCAGLGYRESLTQHRREPFRWRRANPIGSLGMMLRHGILIRFFLMLLLVDMANGSIFACAYRPTSIMSPAACVSLPGTHTAIWCSVCSINALLHSPG